MDREFLAELAHHLNSWMVHVFVIVLLTALVGMALHWVLDRVQQQTTRTRTLWDDAAFSALEKPLLALVWVLGLNVACMVIAENTEAFVFRYANQIRSLAFIVILAWFLTRVVGEVENRLLSPQRSLRRVDPTSTHAIAKLARISVIVTASLILLERLGYSVAGVMAFGGIGGIAVGFAAKDMLANFFGGLMIFLDRPFSIGDWVRSPDRNIEGTVEQIGWRQTRIRTFDMRPLYVPNSTFASISVENPSRMTHRRIKETFGLRYQDKDKVGRVLERINALLKKHEGLTQEEAPDASIDKLGASSLDITITAFTRTRSLADYIVAKQDILLKVLDILAEEGVTPAVPAQMLFLANGKAPEAAQQHRAS